MCDKPAAEPALPAPAPQVETAAAALPEALTLQIGRMAQDAAGILLGTAPSGSRPRIEVLVGRLDPHLRLAPCQKLEPYLPAGSPVLGRTRMGLRCTQGSKHWNVSLPLQVRVWARSLTASTALPFGTVLQAQHLVVAEVDLAALPDPAIGQPDSALGRTLSRGLEPGQALRRGDLKLRQWFNTGDTVRITAVGEGYAISSEGQALGPGLEGQSIRVRTETGRIISGMVSGDRRVDVAL